VKVLPLPLEERVRLDLHPQDEITGGAPLGGRRCRAGGS
jgi:hypothetical protein